MKRSSKELKRIARDILNNRYNVPMGAFVTASLITTVFGIPFSLSLGDFPSTTQLVVSALANYLILLIGMVLNTGVLFIHLNLTRGREVKLSQVFTPFLHNTERYFLGAFLFSLLEILSCLPMIGGALFFYFQKDLTVTIPALAGAALLTALLLLGVTLNYSFVFFLLFEKPELGVTALFHESRLIMKHQKGRFFYLLVSFLPWMVPILCSFGIASLWIRPYMTQTFVNFYLDCTGELNRIPVRDYTKESSPFTNSNF